MADKTGARLAGGLGEEREENDFYATPEHDVHNFLDTTGLVPTDGLVLEPSAGLGHIVRPLKEKRPTATIISGDKIQRDFQLDYVNDFLALGTNYLQSLNINCVITNPPFKHAREFIEHSLSFCDGDVIMLLKLAFLEGKTRQTLYDKKMLREVWVSRARVNCVKPAQMELMAQGSKPPSSTMAMAWFVFNRNYQGEPVLRWL